MGDFLMRLVGEPVAILCARYWYRGIVHTVSGDAVVLTQARAVEITGSATAAEPATEDVIPSDICISLGAVELVCQPTWCYHGIREGK